MAKYLLKRIVHGMVSIVIVVLIVMMLIYSLMDKDKIFAQIPIITKILNNDKVLFKHRTWERYGYIDYIEYREYIVRLEATGELKPEEKSAALRLGKTPGDDSAITKKYVDGFAEYYTSMGYNIVRLNAKTKSSGRLMKGGRQALFAYKDIPVIKRAWKYFTGIIKVDNINKANEVAGERGLKFTFHDPLYGGKKFSPAIIGNGTNHKYLLYFDNRFPYIHQNLVGISLGESFSVEQGVDIYNTMTRIQGSYVYRDITYPTGFSSESPDNLHSARYIEGSREVSTLNQERFPDDYTDVDTYKNGKSRIGYSFIIGILSVIMAYFLGIPLGIVMARKKDRFLDKLGTAYIVFIMAVPSLAYIFMFAAIGRKAGLPTTFNVDSTSKMMYVLPIVSLALPSVANLMKWLRRFMIDQMNADYVKFARSGGLSEREIFSKHILKNAIIPLVHGIPASVLGALVGAIITESVYVVPGTGKLLTNAITFYDNSVIVGVTLFYAILSVASLIMGDLLMATVDPRISFVTKER